ncbi:MAG: hypothetical protein WCJ39_01135 [bacterium]
MATSTEDICDPEIRNILEETIRTIEEGLVNNRDFTESRVLRNAAVNRFECKLTTNEKVKLNNFTGKIKKLCLANGLETLAESTDFSQESDAQKIMKVSDIISQLNGAGVDISQDLVKEFEPLDEKIKPLRDLDKHYKHVTKTLNMLHRIAQKGYKSMVTPAQERKVQAVVAKINMTKTVNDALTAYNNKDNFDKNEEHTYLENLLEQVKQSPDFKKALHDNMMSEAEFNERFTVGNVYYMMEAAKKGLDGQKGTAF